MRLGRAARVMERVLTVLRSSGDIGAVAARAQLTRVTLHAWASGRTAPRASNMLNLAEGLELHAGDLEDDASELNARAGRLLELAKDVRAVADEMR